MAGCKRSAQSRLTHPSIYGVALHTLLQQQSEHKNRKPGTTSHHTMYVVIDLFRDRQRASARENGHRDQGSVLLLGNSTIRILTNL